MNYIRAFYISTMSVLVIVLMWSWQGAFAGPLGNPFVDVRYCGYPVKRDADGRISRRADVLREFKKLYPCKATGKTNGPCPGWAINHSIPLACGGCDAVYNLDWMPDAIKSCAGKVCRDRWELSVYCTQFPQDPK